MTYNLLTEKWIPVENNKYEQEKVSLFELFERAHELNGISEQLATYQMGLYMLMINIATDMYRPMDIYDIKDILNNKKFNVDTLNQYFDTCGRDRFDIFNEYHPFLQYFGKKLNDKKKCSIANLTSNLPHGVNVLHKTSLTEDKIYLTAEEATKALIASYISTPGSGAGKASIQYDAMQTFILKSNLFETITVNIPVCDQYDFDKAPAPWRRNDNEVNLTATSLPAFIYAPYRFLKLIPTEDGLIKELYKEVNPNYDKENAVCIKSALNALMPRTPFVTYFPVKKDEIAYLRITNVGTLKFWSDLVTLKCINSEVYHPDIIDQYRNGLMENDESSISVMIFDVAFENQCKYVSYGKHTCSIPAEILNGYRSTFIEAVNFVDVQSSNIWAAINSAYNITFNGELSDSKKSYIQKSVEIAKDKFFHDCKIKFNTIILDGILNNKEQDEIIADWKKEIRKSAYIAIYNTIIINNYNKINYRALVTAIDVKVNTFKKLQKPTKRKEIESMGINEVIRRMSTGEVSVFKRWLGNSLTDVDLRTRLTFEKYFGNYTNKDKNKLFLAVCAHCQKVEVNDNHSLSDAVAGYHASKEQTDSFVTKVENMLILSWTKDEKVLTNAIGSLVRQVNSKGCYVDAESLFNDLKWWDDNKHYVQINFVRNAFGTINK